MAIIVIHTNPDFDCITGAWLLTRFVPGFEEASIEFVNTGNPDQALLSRADAVIDTGKIYDPSDFRFDHHQLPGQASNDTCAAKMTFDFMALGLGPDHPAYLQPLIDIVFCGDTGRKESGADWSRDVGLHALLSGYKLWFGEQVKPVPDENILAWAFGILDILNARLKSQAKIKAELSGKVVHKSLDGLVWAIKHGSTGSSFAAFEEGARLVVFEGEPLEVEGGTTYPLGVMRSGEWQEPHVGELVERAIAHSMRGVEAELSTWFKHPAGFFAGRGTAKAPVFKPVEVDLGFIARLIDGVWKR
jgi:hypothetical protein